MKRTVPCLQIRNVHWKILALCSLLWRPGGWAAPQSAREPLPEREAVTRTAEPPLSPSPALTSQWSPRLRLEEQGVKPFASLTGELWRNTSGGVQIGSWWNTMLDFGLELDTAQLGLWPGGSVMAQVHWVQNQSSKHNFAEKTGALNPVSSIMAQDHWRVYNLYYQQSWREGAYTLKIGQQAADDDFMASDYSALFLNSAFGAMPSQVGTPLGADCNHNPPFPIFPVAGPGLFFSMRPSDKWYAQAGLYHGRPGEDAEDNQGFDWETERHTGIGVFYEGGYSYQIGSQSGAFKLGGTLHSGRFDDYRSINAGEPEATVDGHYSFYAINDLVLVSNQAGSPVLACFGRAGFSPQSDRSMVSFYADAGLNWFGPLPGRPQDVAGAAFSYTQFGKEYRRTTAPQGVSSAESVLELTYRAQIRPWLALQVDLQFLFNPALNPNSSSRDTATVLGLRADVVF